MALIGSIRKRSWVLVVVIGVAMLLFIIGDFRSLFGTNLPVEAEAYEEPVRDDQLRAEVRSVFPFIEEGSNQTGMPMNPSESERNQWRQFLREYLFNQEYDAIGIGEVTDEEFINYLVNNTPTEALRDPMFLTSQGQFNPDTLRARLEQGQIEAMFDSRIDQLTSQMGTADPQLQPQYQNAIEQLARAKEDWLMKKQYYRMMRRRSKYAGLVEGGFYATTLEGEKANASTTQQRTVKYVMKPFSTITDKEFELTDADLEAYYEAHKDDKKYELPELRSLKYVKFNVRMSDRDIAKHEGKLQEIMEEFKNPAISDSAVVMKHTANANPGMHPWSLPLRPEQLPTGLDTTQIAMAEVGAVFGPFVTMDMQRQPVSQLIKKVGTSLDTAEVRHILIGAEGNGRTLEEAARVADSVINLIANGANFDTLAAQMSDDPGVVQNGGKYTFERHDGLVQPFKDYGFNAPIGQVDKVETSFGYHVMEVLRRNSVAKTKVATVSIPRTPSPATISQAKTRLLDLSYEMEDDQFDKIAADSGLTVEKVMVLEDQSIPVRDLYDRSMDVKKFAFKTDNVGNVSDPIRVENSFYIFQIDIVQHKDEAPNFEIIKDQMRPMAEADKKAKKYLDQLKKVKSIDEAANVMGVKPLTGSLSFNSINLPSSNPAQAEYEVIGKVFGVEEGQVGKLQGPWVGKDGLYMVVVESIAPASEQEVDLMGVRENVLRQNMPTSTEDELFRALSEISDLQDYFWQGTKKED